MLSHVRQRLIAVIRRHPNRFRNSVVGLSLMLWLLVGSSLWVVYGALTGLPDSNAVRTVGSMPRATTILDVRGRHAFTIFQEQRLPVPLTRISPHMVRAVVTIEDQRFYDHGGVDVIRVLAAALNNVREGRREQGGSTITQQLARLTFLTADKTYRRKLQEIILAVRLEQVFTKDQILELYLNKAYFGDGLYGVEAASLGYLGKHASELDVADAALLAGLVKSPSSYAPTVSPERAIARRNVGLRLMREAGTIAPRVYDAARAKRLVLSDTLRREEAFGQYFKEEVRQQLVKQFGWERVHNEGLRVETTLDLDMQKAAEVQVAQALDEIERRQLRGRRKPSDEPLQAALVAIDPQTGEVRAMVGGRRFEQSKFNRVTQARRQPGSAFKPFVYAAAIERGYSPATVLRGLSEPIQTVQGAWIPADGHSSSDSMTMRAALRVSSNRAAVRMLEELGAGAAVDYAARFGMPGMPAVPSLALGSGEVTLLSLTSAYGALANDGIHAAPRLIRRVRNSRGDVLHESALDERTVVKPSTAFLVTSMLEDVVNGGTAYQVRALGFRAPAAGKTGTTNDYRDAWFVGYTPALVTGVWVGYDQPRTIMPNGYAAQLAVPLWTRFMAAATADDEPRRFRAPSGVVSATICPLSGALATEACLGDPLVRVYTEIFARGSEPDHSCPYHRYTTPAPFTLAAAATPPPSVISQGPTVAPSASDIPPPPPVIAAVEPPRQHEEPKKKRGFWSRIFGGGDDDDRKKRDRD